MFRSLVLIPSALLAGLLLPGRASAAPTHSHLHQALHDLKGAVSELEGAGHNYGGHREQALKDLKIAVIQIEKALVAVGDPYHKDFKPKADLYKDHRHLRHSEHSIGAAIEELRESKHFGDAKDHKEKVIEALKAAHVQVKDCLKHAK